MRRWVALLAIATVAASTAACASASDEEVGASDEALDSDWGEIADDFSVVSDAEFENAAVLSDLAPDPTETKPEDATPLAANDPTTASSMQPIGIPAPTRIGLPPGCNPATSLELAVYYERSDVDLLPALAKHATACSRYFINIPKVSGSALSVDASLWPRPIRGAGVHALGPAFRATAEFHWGSTGNRLYPGWKNVEVMKDSTGAYVTQPIPRSKYFRVDWYAKGVLFRQRMAKRGYLTQSGDTWHINELESSWIRSRAYLKVVKELTDGLADGDPNYDAFTDPDPAIQPLSADEKNAINESAHKKGVRGIVYISSMGHRLPGEKDDTGKMNAIKQVLRSKFFWQAMANDVEMWGQERYPGYGRYCNGGTLAAQTDRLTSFQEELIHIAREAPRYRSGSRAGQSTVGTALFYLSRNYTPVINAAWSAFSGDVNESVGAVGDFFAGQVYAARSYDVERHSPFGRIGIYFHPNVERPVSPADNAKFAERTAYVLNATYNGRNGRPQDACGSGCVCR